MKKHEKKRKAREVAGVTVVTLTTQLEAIGIKSEEIVNTYVEGDKVIIEKVKEEK